jgi:hypothetical protein
MAVNAASHELPGARGSGRVPRGEIVERTQPAAVAAADFQVIATANP